MRPATAADLDGLERLERAAFSSDRLSPRSTRRLLARPSAAILVAVTGAGGVAGSVVVLFRKGSARARIYSLAVDPARRGEGLGRRLVTAAEEEAARRGARTVTLEVRADNAAAIALYESLGYRASGEVPDYYADGETAMRMARALAPAA